MDPTPAAKPAPPAWIVEATLLLVLCAHAACVAATALTAKAMPLVLLDTCVFAPLGLGLSIAGAATVARRTERRGRLAVLTLLLAAATLSPRWAMRCLEDGAMRDLQRAGGPQVVVAEGRALLARHAAETVIAPGQLGPVLSRVGVEATVHPGRCVRVRSYGRDEFFGFVILPEGALPQGRRVADGLCWWSDVDHGRWSPRQ